MIQIMKIGTDKWKHFGINYAICALLGNYGVPFALGASLGKEYGDKMSPGNKWDWKDILADLAGIVAAHPSGRIMNIPDGPIKRNLPFGN